MLDQWQDQYAPDNGWDMYPEPADGSIPHLREPPAYADLHDGKHVIYMVDEQEPERLANNANNFYLKILHTHTKEKERVVVHTISKQD